MILYHAVSTYQIVEVILHRRKYYSKNKCILFLPDFIIDKYPDYFNVVQLGFFDEVYLCPYLYLKHDEKFIFENVQRLIQSCLPYDLYQFEKIYVAGAHFYLSVVLVQKKISFDMFEDAPGILSNWEVLYKELKQKYSVHAKIAADLKLFNGKNKNIKHIIVHDRVKNNPKRQKIFRVNEEIRHMQKEEIKRICMLFHAPYFDIDAAKYKIVLTERLYVLGKMSKEEQIKFYQEVVYKYVPEKKLIIKPHPDDAIDYKKIFPNAIIIPREVPAELLPYLFKERAKKILAGNTTAINSLRTFFIIEKYTEEKYENYRSNSGKV